MLKQLHNFAEFKDFISGNGFEFPENVEPFRIAVVHFSATWIPQCEKLNEALSLLPEAIPVKFEAADIDAENVPEAALAYKIVAAPTTILFQNGLERSRVDGFKPADIRKQLLQLHESPAPASYASLDDRLKQLINRRPLMLFIKGSPEHPNCGFSRQLIELLNGINVEYGYFDILSDEEVRQGLKKFSNWPTYPQVYLNGELLGGLDVIREELQDAEFVAKLPKRETLDDRLRNLINSSRLMVFMKGSPDQPRCGFSRQTIDLLREVNAEFKHFDILSDEEGLKAFSNWPTYPQLYLDGELIGGLDVLREELEDDEFAKRLPRKT